MNPALLVLLLATLVKPDAPRVSFREGPLELLPLEEPRVIVRMPPRLPAHPIIILRELHPPATVRL